jgi:hypothetical protein
MYTVKPKTKEELLKIINDTIKVKCLIKIF